MNIQSSIFPKAYTLNNTLKGQSQLLERTPSCDVVSFSGVKIGDKVKEMLDTTEFEFQKYNGDIFKGTIRDYFEDSIILKNPIRDNFSLIHCTGSKETAMSILNNGLDWQKTGRMKCGPGTYFSPSAYGGMEQGGGSVPIEGIYKGNKTEYPVFEQSFYEAVDYNKDIHNAVKELTSDDTRKVVNRYCHDLLQEDMGIDFLYASSGYGTGAYAVINNDCMRLSRYNW